MRITKCGVEMGSEQKLKKGANRLAQFTVPQAFLIWKKKKAVSMSKNS